MNIRSRFEFYLAKIAGKDVDTTKLTPSGASNVTEQLMLELAEKMGDISSATQNATTTTAGVVKKAAAVAYAAGEAPTAAEFKSLIDALVTAGIMEANS